MEGGRGEGGGEGDEKGGGKGGEGVRSRGYEGRVWEFMDCHTPIG